MWLLYVVCYFLGYSCVLRCVSGCVYEKEKQKIEKGIKKIEKQT